MRELNSPSQLGRLGTHLEQSCKFGGDKENRTLHRKGASLSRHPLEHVPPNWCEVEFRSPTTVSQTEDAPRAHGLTINRVCCCLFQHIKQLTAINLDSTNCLGIRPYAILFNKIGLSRWYRSTALSFQS